jgi:hypothetical protein
VGFECSVMFVAFLVDDPMICLDRRVVALETYCTMVPVVF